GLDGGWDKPLRLADMLLYSWDKGLDVCMDLTGSSSLPQTRMVDFVSDRVVIEAAQRKCVKCLTAQILGTIFSHSHSLLLRNMRKMR
nr:hypothetical protein [Tanacetum cinerariifolium]